MINCITLHEQLSPPLSIYILSHWASSIACGCAKQSCFTALCPLWARSTCYFLSRREQDVHNLKEVINVLTDIVFNSWQSFCEFSLSVPLYIWSNHTFFRFVT